MTQLQGKGSIEAMCAAAAVSRASYYRRWAERAPKAEETELRDLIQRLALADRHLGYRRITWTLRRRHGLTDRSHAPRHP